MRHGRWTPWSRASHTDTSAFGTGDESFGVEAINAAEPAAAWRAEIDTARRADGELQKLSMRVLTAGFTGTCAPLQRLESEVPRCENCGGSFGMIVKSRHQCRRCGKVVCDECSKRKARLDNFHRKMQRVCPPCYNDLAKGRSYGTDGAYSQQDKYKSRIEG